MCSGIGTGAALVPVMSAGFRGLELAAVPRASRSIRIMQQLGGSFGSAALFIIVQHELTTHAHNAAGLAAAFGAAFWWVLAFAGAMLIPVLFLPGTRQAGPRAARSAHRGGGREVASRSAGVESVEE